MRERLRLPALRGNDSLGFLAALGIVSLSEQAEISPLRLGWDGSGAPIAVVHGPDFVDQLAAELLSAFERLRTRGGVLPGVDANLPLGRQSNAGRSRSAKGTPLVQPGGDGADPMRMSRREMANLYGSANDAWPENPWWGRWLISLAAQATADAKGVSLTPFNAPTGQMSMRASIFERTMDAVARVGGPGDALRGWRRTYSQNYAAANFDERALRDGTVTTSGGPQNQGAPSPTWLATMAIRLFPLVDDGRETAAVGWRRLALYPGYTRRSFVWPVWRRLLDAPAVRALMAHPSLAVVEKGPYEVVADRPRDLEALDVTGLFGASRRTLTQGDGPLGPTKRIWPRA